MKTKRNVGISAFCLLATVLIVAMLLGACATTATPTPASPAKVTKTLELGGIAMLSGPGSQGGLAYKQGWQLVVDKYNAAGGLKVGNDTYQLSLTVEDDQMSADQGATAATRLVSKDVKIIFGGLIGYLKNTIYPVTSKAGALYAAVDGVNASRSIKFPSNADVDASKPLYIRTYHSFNETVPSLLDFLVEKYPDVKTVALNCANEDDARPFGAYIKQELEKRGLKQAGDMELWGFGTDDFAPLVTRILATKPDAIMMAIGGPTTAGSEMKVAMELGFKGPMFYPAHADVALQAVISGPKTTDMFGACVTLSDPSMPQAIKDVKAQYLQKYPENQLIADVMCAYDGLWVLLQTIEKAQSLDPQTIVTTYEGLTQPDSFQTLLGPAYVGGLKTYGVNRVLCGPYAIGHNIKGVITNAKYPQISIP